MRIGILGGFGFLGRNLSPILNANHEVFIASRTNGLDAKNLHDLVEWINESKLDCLINLAGNCGGVGLNQSNPANLWLDTTTITASVLEACRITKIKKLVMIGSVCSYAKYCPTPFQETDLMCHGFPEETNAGYGVAKLNGLFGCIAYRKQHGLNAIYLILVNLFGKWDNFDPQSSHVIPALIRRTIEAKKNGHKSLVVWGDGTATREFLYAEDCAKAIKLAAENYNEEFPINIGSGQEVSIKELAILIKKIVGYEGEIIWDSSKPNGQPKRRLNTHLANEKLKFQYQTSLEEGLKNTIEWYNNAQ